MHSTPARGYYTATALSPMVTIVIRNLTKRFGQITALDDVSLRIESGELFFLLGPSGCGKTTLLRTIAGFYTPHEGQLLFNNEDVSHLAPHLRNTAMMFQSYALWPHMTVARNVAFGLEQRKTPRPEIEKRVGEALEMVKMHDYADRKINELSGGQQQRVALARALVVRPKCLLLDEPLSNLDAKLRLEMRTEIRDICKNFGLTGVYVTHDQKEALSMADRMAILENGRISQVGTPQEIYREPQSCSVANFIGETNFVNGTISGPAAKGLYRVDTRLGEFVGRPPNPEELFDGDTVTLSIRPECLRIDPHADLGLIEPNTISGTLVEATYLGELAQYTLDTGRDPAMINISELNPAFLLPPGEVPLCARVESRDVLVLPQVPSTRS